MSLAEAPRLAIPESVARPATRSEMMRKPDPTDDEIEANPTLDPAFRRKNKEVQIDILHLMAWTEAQISRETRIPIERVREHCAVIRADRLAFLQQSDDEVKARIAANLAYIAGAVISNPRTRENQRDYLVAIEAMKEELRVREIGTVAKSMSVNYHSIHSDAGLEEAMVDDPKIRQLVLDMEERQREIEAERALHDPRQVRRDGERRVVALQAPSSADEPGCAQGHGGGDQPPPLQHAPAGWQEPVHVEVVPGLVSRQVPGSEGDLG